MAKKLLKESTIRRFQKLANVGTINEMYSQNEEYLNEEDELEDEEAGAEGAPADFGGEEAEGAEDMGDMDMDAEGAMDGDLELTDEEAQAIIDLGTKLEQAMGGMDMDGEEADMDMGPEAGAEAEMGEEEIMEALRGISYVPSQGEVVNEVAKRVARRLKAAKLHEAKLNRALGKRR
jgi:hypothetical protein